jgi:osmotically-inducible protein OsmY
LKPGNKVTVTGSRVIADDTPYLIATKIKEGNEEMQIRDKERILNSSLIKTRNIDVKVSDGKVILSGNVTSSAEADQAQLLG